jgi:allophanate hydrolase subunit 2
VSIDGERPIDLADGGELVVPAVARAVRYLAIAGGVDLPLVLGSRATLVVAGLGGYMGRWLRAGDVLASRVSPGRPAHAVPTVSDPADPAELVVMPGPHVARFPDGALERFLTTTWRVSARSDRVGVRLEGGEIPRLGDDRAPPAPMVRGAIQITTDGTPIVLGPDHPVTGGYPVIAVVSRASQAVLARLRAKRPLCFALADATPTS